MTTRNPPLVLGIETSCDETAVAIVRGDRTVAAEAVFSQLEAHAPFGGVVPEIAARAHAERLDGMIASAMEGAGLSFTELDAVAVTAGPGLAGGLLVGVVTAQAIARVHGLPLLPINHLEGHALTARFSAGIPFPYLLLLVSGGHCQLLAVEGVGRYRRLGTTIDDAVGEAFDKVAKMLGLGYPGGPVVERLAATGDPGRFAFPRPLAGQPGCNFSFSGLKTAVRQRILALGGQALTDPQPADLCAGFQSAAIEVLCDRCGNAMSDPRVRAAGIRRLVAAGGVAANRAIRTALAQLAGERGFELILPPLRLCGDNAVMIAWAGIERMGAGMWRQERVQVRPRWPLDPEAEPAPGAGVKA